jgi:ABC-2 type transport system ATP-binding protein
MEMAIRTRELRKVYTGPPPTTGISPFGAGSLKARLLERLSKKGDTVALDGLTLEVEPGQIFGLLGPNGAGKTTTVGVLTTRVRPNSGEAWIRGYEVWQQQVQAKRLIGVVPQRPNLDFSLTAREILVFHAAYFGIPSAERQRRADILLDRFHLIDRANDMVLGFSEGMMQRLSIARAMMHEPELLFLDEPSAGLDPQTRLLLWDIIREYQARGKTVLLTTHNMEEADTLCDRIAIVDHGKVIACGTPAELKSSIPGGYLIQLRFSQPAPDISARLLVLPGVTQVKLSDESADVYADRGGPLVTALVAAVAAEGVDLIDIHISTPSLETLFLHHTGRSLRQ